MNKHDIIRLLTLEIQRSEASVDKHVCSAKSTIRYIVNQDKVDQSRKILLSWRRIGAFFISTFDAAAYILGILFLLLFTAVFIYILFDYYKMYFTFH